MKITIKVDETPEMRRVTVGDGEFETICSYLKEDYAPVDAIKSALNLFLGNKSKAIEKRIKDNQGK